MIMAMKKYFLWGFCLSLLSGICISCADEELLSDIPDREVLLEEGKYLTISRADGEKVGTFEEGTPYRLLIYSTPYDETNPDEEGGTKKLRINTVAVEKVMEGTNYRYVELQEENASEWLGFRPMSDEVGQRSLSFYGFTYGKPASGSADYIPVEKEINQYYREESVDDEGELADLFRGELINQNEHTAAASSEIRFKHAFSRLWFDVLQQREGEEAWEIAIESVEVVGTYKKGKVDLFSGEIHVEVPYDRPLVLATEYKVNPTINSMSKHLGEMILFPTYEGISKANKELGLKIKIRGKEEDVRYFASNVTQGTDGSWYGTISIETIYSSTTTGGDVTSTLTPLYLRSNVSYTIRIVFMEEGVRVITIVPQVYEWLPGEGTEEQPWQEQELGQPIVFANAIWSDRNLGADGWDSKTDFVNTIGYFYQANRNIPYWPFYQGTDVNDYVYADRNPLPEEKRKVSLTEYASTWGKAAYWPYPMIDATLLKRSKTLPRPHWHTADNNNLLYEIGDVDETKSFGFFAGENNYTIQEDYWKTDDYTTHPTPKGWAIPTFEQFQSIFPSTPFAGNLTFRKSSSTAPSNWNSSGGLETEFDTIQKLRVCVPFYKDGINTHCTNPGNCPYCKQWVAIDDPGSYPNETVYVEGLQNGKGPFSSREALEPDGDPSQGYCSVYIISRADGDREELPEGIGSSEYKQRSWGTIYGIKKVGTSEAYRLRWQVKSAWMEGDPSPKLYVVISQYECKSTDNLLLANYKTAYDWDNPVAEAYFPISGMIEGKSSKGYYNSGCEGIYATCGTDKGKKYTLRMKITGDNRVNQYISVIKGDTPAHGLQIRCIRIEN